MTEEQIQLAVIRDTIAQAPESLRVEVAELASRIRALVKEHEGTGVIALALVGAEIAASA